MKRSVNVRPLLICAISFILGIFAFYELLFADFWFGAVVAAILVVLIIVLACIRTKYVYLALFALIFLLLGFARSYLGYAAISQNEVFGKQTVIRGRVTDLGVNGGGTTLYLDNCTDSDGNSYDGLVRVSYISDDMPQTGDVVAFNGAIHSVYPLKKEVDSFSIRNDVRYQLQHASLVAREQGTLELDETVRKYVFDVTCGYMRDNGGVMYALLTGDRNALDSGAEWAFGGAGVIHLLAVSGLHVGFVAAIVCFVLKRFKLHPALECAIVLVPLAFYAYVCGFSPSVVRAIVMLVCTYIARLLFGRYDMLSSMSLAALVVLCICPFYLFDVGFQLSFMSVYGIATLLKRFNGWIHRKQVNKHVARLLNLVGISASCALSTFFVMASHGMDIALFGVFVNLIAVPLVSAAFVLGLFGLIPWVFHYLMVASDALLQAVRTCTLAVAKISFATASVAALSVGIAIVCVMLFGAGGYINLNKVGKRIFYPICAFLLVLCIVFTSVPTQSGNAFYVCSTNDDNLVAAVCNGEATLVGDFDNYGATDDAVRFLNGYGCKKVTLYIAHYSETNQGYVEQIQNRLGIDKVYLLGFDANVQVDEYFAKQGIQVVRQYPNTQTGGAVTVRSLIDAGLEGALVQSDGLSVCIAYSERGAEQLLHLGLGADVYVLPAADKRFSDAVVTLSAMQGDLPFNYGANKCGNFTIKRNSGKISLSFR